MFRRSKLGDDGSAEEGDVAKSPLKQIEAFEGPLLVSSFNSFFFFSVSEKLNSIDFQSDLSRLHELSFCCIKSLGTLLYVKRRTPL